MQSARCVTLCNSCFPADVARFTGFEAGTTTLTLVEGESTTHRFTINANPDPSSVVIEAVTSDNVPDSITISMEDNSRSIVITNANFADSGRYLLRATNMAGNSSVQFGVDVQCKFIAKGTDRVAGIIIIMKMCTSFCCTA